jgi:hypothetical protein
MDDKDNCLICLDLIKNQNYTFPKHCNCKVKLHLECLNQIEKYKLLCPICRIKLISNINYDQNLITSDIFNHEPIILYFPLYLFFRNPNFLTFMIYLCFSFLITIFYVVPMVLIYGMCDYAYRNKIIYGFATIMFIYFIKSIIIDPILF